MSQDTGATDELAALTRALDRIDAMPGSPAKTAAIREAAVSLEKLSERAAKMREAEVLRLRYEKLLTLAPLADQVGISKARAGQIVKAEERRQEEARDG